MSEEPKEPAVTKLPAFQKQKSRFLECPRCGTGPVYFRLGCLACVRWYGEDTHMTTACQCRDVTVPQSWSAHYGRDLQSMDSVEYWRYVRDRWNYNIRYRQNKQGFNLVWNLKSLRSFFTNSDYHKQRAAYCVAQAEHQAGYVVKLKRVLDERKAKMKAMQIEIDRLRAHVQRLEDKHITT